MAATRGNYARDDEWLYADQVALLGLEPGAAPVSAVWRSSAVSGVQEFLRVPRDWRGSADDIRQLFVDRAPEIERRAPTN